MCTVRTYLWGFQMHDTSASLRASVIVPAYNEEATIIQLLESVRRQKVDGVELEVIVIDDGSKDRTLTLLQSSPHVFDKLIVQPSNRGKGAAVQAGLRAATGDYILFQDADLEYSPTDYPTLFFPVKNLNADIVMGSRFMVARYTRVQYFWHKIGNLILTQLFNILFNTTFTDVYSCYLLYRRSLVRPDDLKSAGWEQHAEILCRAVSRAKVIYEVPISYYGRSYEEGKKIKAYHIFSVLTMILRCRVFKPKSSNAGE